jgi:hypothetical protein
VPPAACSLHASIAAAAPAHGALCRLWHWYSSVTRRHGQTLTVAQARAIGAPAGPLRCRGKAQQAETELAEAERELAGPQVSICAPQL